MLLLFVSTIYTFDNDLLTVFDGLVLFSMLTHHFTSISKPFAVKTKNVYMLI